MDRYLKVHPRFNVILQRSLIDLTSRCMVFDRASGNPAFGYRFQGLRCYLPFALGFQSVTEPIFTFFSELAGENGASLPDLRIMLVEGAYYSNFRLERKKLEQVFSVCKLSIRHPLPFPVQSFVCGQWKALASRCAHIDGRACSDPEQGYQARGKDYGRSFTLHSLDIANKKPQAMFCFNGADDLERIGLFRYVNAAGEPVLCSTRKVSLQEWEVLFRLLFSRLV